MKRGRPSGPNIKKIQLILDVLYQYPSGVWIRQISKASNLPVSTVHFYLSHYFEPFIENIGFKTDSGKYLGFRLIKLKRQINAADIMAYINLKKSIKNITL